jgi:hypothetical protein
MHICNFLILTFIHNILDHLLSRDGYLELVYVFM